MHKYLERSELCEDLQEIPRLFVPDDEKRLVEEVFSNAVDCLSDEDKKLPQVKRTHLFHFVFFTLVL